jgi:hypothetical protein
VEYAVLDAIFGTQEPAIYMLVGLLVGEGRWK